MNNRLKNLSIDSILEWNQVEKGIAVCFVCFVASFWDGFIISLLYGITIFFNIPPNHAITKSGFEIAINLALIFGTLCLVSMAIGWQLSGASKKQQELFSYAAMSVYVLGNAIIMLLMGTLSLPSGVLLAGAPILGWILFDKKGVLYATILGIVIGVSGFWLAFFGYIPYVLIVDESYGIFSNLSYNAAMNLMVLPHSLLLLYIAYRAIFQWKDREAYTNHLAQTDSLTKVANRRQIDQVLANAIANNKSWLSVIMFDVDHFKKINDNFGHNAGDEILNQVIVAIKSVVRERDKIGRFGGDEFMVVLPNTNKQTAAQIAKRCLEAVNEANIQYQKTTLEVTISIGLQTASYSTKNVDTLFKQLVSEADTALYQAKTLGRNRVEVA